MNRLMLAAALSALGLMSAPAAQAAPPGHPGFDRPGYGRPGYDRPGYGYGRPGYGPGYGRGGFVGPDRPYYHTHGVRFSGGYYYGGRDHSHWGHRHWDAGFRRYHYYDPYLRSYYFWCPERVGYYPVARIAVGF
ncbi:MAG: hypothetical protein ACRC33_02340 [Gemmataceae bacterium]